MKTLRWTFLLALQSNRSAEFPILHSPALIPQFPQSPSSSYLFSHLECDDHSLSRWNPERVAIALKLLPVFTHWLLRIAEDWLGRKWSQSPSSSYLFSHFAKSAFSPNNRGTISRNRPQALTCFHTAAVFNTENLRLFKPQNTNLSF